MCVDVEPEMGTVAAAAVAWEAAAKLSLLVLALSLLDRGVAAACTGWFRLNAQNCVPGNSSRRFFELDHEILHTYSGHHYLKLEEGFFLIFLSRWPVIRGPGWST